MEPHLSWNLVEVLRQLFEFPFMVNAIAAGTMVAIASAAVGWFAVLRRETFTVHTLGVVGFPGASLAALIGISVGFGYVLFAVLAAAVIALTTSRGESEHRESAVVGTVQAFALSSGFLFVSLSHRNVSTAQTLLFGTVLGVTRVQVWWLGAVAVVTLGVLLIVGRSLLFASIDREVAEARGVPTRALDLLFLGLLALAAGTASQITGSLLAFALLVIPPATAQMVTARVSWSISIAVGLALISTWAGLVAAYFGDWPIGFAVPTVAFAAYALAHLVRGVRGGGLMRERVAGGVR
jgi:zinc/manganese transport system permease protein